MDLFVMSRFATEVKEESNVNALSENEAKILAKLNARRRKREAETAETAEIPSNVSEEKPDYSILLQDIEIKDGIATMTTEEKPKKKKRKKDKTGTNIATEDAPATENTEKEKESTEHEETENVENGETENAENGEQETAESTEPLEEPLGTGFTVLEEVKQEKMGKIHRVLPNWLAKPSVISCDLIKNKLPVKDVKGLDRFITDALKRNKIHNFFPVQQQIIPWLLQSQNSLYRPCDMCVSAPTGSGKTLAFVLPTVQALVKQSVLRLRCLVVLPVHDLAVQVHRVYSSFCRGTKLHVALISGNTSFSEEQQLLVRRGKNGEYLSKADIVVCTPGRLVDHLQRTPGFSLTSLRYLIIDEADRIMDETHNDWLYHVEKAISTSMEALVAQKLSRPWENYVQKLLFSATLSQDPEKLTRLGLFQPKLFTSVVATANDKENENDETNENENAHQFVGKYTTPAELTEHTVSCSPTLKPLVVYHLMKKFKFGPTLCFSVSKAATHRLCLLLQHFGDLKVAECSSEIGKGQRDKLLSDFSNGKYDLMVCTDAVARGMDLGVVDCVISYDPPKFVKNHIHRIGRTARAGKPGTAITLLTDNEASRFQKLIDHAQKKNVTGLDVSGEELEVYEDQFRSALQTLKTSVVEEKKAKSLKSDKARRKKGFRSKSAATAAVAAEKARKPIRRFKKPQSKK